MPTFAVGLVLRQVFVMVLGLLSVAFVYNIFLFFSSGMFQGVIWFGTSSTLLLSFANLLLLLIYVILKSAGKIASKADKNMFVVYIIYFIIDRFFS